MTASAGLAGRWPARENLVMAVPVSVTSAMWSRRPTVAGQSRSRTRICMPVITTPSAPGRLTSCSSRCLASRRDWLTSSVQPATSTLPDPQRAWPARLRSSCRDPIEMPSARPAGTHPAAISFAKSCPETSQVKAPAARARRPREPRCRWP